MRVSYCRLAGLAGPVLPPATTTLSLTRCQLSTVGRPALAPLAATLTSLDLSSNLLAALPSALQPLRSLHSLQLAHNRLETVEPASLLAGLVRLARLDLSYNHLSAAGANLSLSPLASTLTHLRHHHIVTS